MTEVTYRGWRIERNATGMWEGRKDGLVTGPWPSEEALQASIDRLVQEPPDIWPQQFGRVNRTPGPVEVTEFVPLPNGAGGLGTRVRVTSYDARTREVTTGVYTPASQADHDALVALMSEPEVNPIWTAFTNPLNLLAVAFTWGAIGGFVWVVIHALAR